MWDRRILKSNAKTALKDKYWLAFTVTLLSAVIAAGFGGIYTFISKLFSFFANPFDYFHILTSFDFVNNSLYFPDTLISIFVGLPITVGVARFFVQNHFGVTEFETMFSGFKREYLNGIGAMFVTQLFVVLWSLLLIVPGIIKGIQYIMVPYIISDNPIMPGSRARQISRIMTEGEVGTIFVLLLSFIGWFILGALCFGVGAYFVIPYYEATKAELYIFLRDRVIQTKQVHPAEFGLVPPNDAEPQYE